MPRKIMMPFAYLVVIVNYNDASLTVKCVQSLLSAGAAAECILVINNGTGEENASAYSGNKLKIRTLDVIDNQGYAAGLNYGIRYGQEAGTDWFIFLNNDIEVEPEFLAEIQSAIQNYPANYIFGPKIVYRDEPNLIWFFREKQIGGGVLTVNLDRGKHREQTLVDTVPTDSLSGSAMIINNRVIADIGLFHEEYFLYGEEIDFLWRAKRAGYTLMAVNRAVVRHAVSTSVSKTGQGSFYRFRNQSWFYRKFAPKILFPLLFTFTLSKALISSALAIKKGVSRTRLSSLEGWKAGWFSRIRGGING